MSTNRFLQPWTAQTTGPPKDYHLNKNYAVGVNVILGWVASFSNATITLWQDNKPGDAQGGPSVNLEESYNETTWNWKVSYEGLDPSFNNVFYLAISEGGDGGDSFTSHYFNISDVAFSATPSASSTSLTSTLVASSGTAVSQATGPAATVTVHPSNVGGGTPVGTIVGAVIGAVAGLLLLMGAAWWIWKRRQRQAREGAVARTDVGHDGTTAPMYSERKFHEADANGGVHELNGSDNKDGQPHELHSTHSSTPFELQGNIKSVGG